MAEEKKYSYITFSVNKEEQFDGIIETLSDFQQPPRFYAMIFHDKDVDESGNLKKRHLHVFVKGQPLRITAWADKFQIPPNMIEIPRSVYRCARYLIHADQKDKFQYSIEDVVSSNIGYYKQRWFSDKTQDVKTEFQDFLALRAGRLTPDEFISKYEFQMSSSCFLERLKFYEYSVRNYNLGAKNDEY